MRKLRFCCNWLCVLCWIGGIAAAQEVTVTARVELVSAEKHGKARKTNNVVLWLVPTDGSSSVGSQAGLPNAHPQLVQKNKRFQPHVLVVPVGSTVEFPNRDPFFHNVFSLFEGKRFDLGLYEAGSTRNVVFNKPGISYVFCDIHAEMSAVVIALSTPYYGISDQRGQILIPQVPAGHYALHVWYEAELPDRLNALTREITVSESNSTLGVLRFPTSKLTPTHKDKYGHDYDPPTPENPAYPRP